MAIEDNTKIVYTPSCTVDEAVAKMLGWLRGMYRDRLVPVNEYGIPLEKLQRAHSLGGPLIEQLNDLRIAAQNALGHALAENASPEVIHQLEEEGRKCEEQAALAYEYHLALVDELAKDVSELRIDKAATESAGEPCITLRSLDTWAWDTYKVSIKGDKQPVATLTPDSESDAESGDSETDTSQKLTPTKYKNLSATFAFLLDAYLEMCKDDSYQHKDGSAKTAPLAEHLESMAKRANKGNKLSGQSSESIKSRIEEAIAIKKSKLPNR